MYADAASRTEGLIKTFQLSLADNGASEADGNPKLTNYFFEEEMVRYIEDIELRGQTGNRDEINGRQFHHNQIAVW